MATDQELANAYTGKPDTSLNPGHIKALRRVLAPVEQELADAKEEIARLNSELDYWTNR